MLFFLFWAPASHRAAVPSPRAALSLLFFLSSLRGVYDKAIWFLCATLRAFPLTSLARAAVHSIYVRFLFVQTKLYIQYYPKKDSDLNITAVETHNYASLQIRVFLEMFAMNKIAFQYWNDIFNHYSSCPLWYLFVECQNID